MNDAKDAAELQAEQQKIANEQQEELNSAVPEDPRNKPNPVAGGFAGESSVGSGEGAAEDQTPVGEDGLPADHEDGGGPDEDVDAEPATEDDPAGR